MSGRKSLVLASVLLVASVGYAQRLVETAKKEKERRKKLEGKEVRVIDDRTLENSWNGGTVSEMGESSESSSIDPNEISAITQAQSTPSSGSTSLSGTKQSRQRCEQDLKMAEAEIKRQKELFNKGVSQVATVDTSNTKRPRGSRLQSGSPGTVDVQGSSVSCSQAMSNPSKYPSQASKCKSIKAKIDAAEAKRREALQCLRSR
jgi:hypothetical protein